tara:strand:+ start:41 stop:913 length:873 start_codon:yes stop_codon:yes gene_type:complete
MVMKRVIFSIYIDIPEKEHYAYSFDYEKKHNLNRSKLTRENFSKHRDRLINNKKEYCNNIGVPFMMFEYDLRYQKFQQTLLKNYPVLTKYEVVNFYKIHILEELSKEFDEILYLDFDAITLTKESFFDAWDLSKGICVLDNNNKIKKTMNIIRSTRSPSAKYFNCQAMLIHKGLDPNNDVINTGIIGARKEDIIKLDFFGNFKDTIDLMTKLINVDDGLYPPNIRKAFRYDNETIFSYKINLNNVTIQWLDNKWHYFFDNQFYIPKETKIVHTINKDFDTVWRYCEKHNL